MKKIKKNEYFFLLQKKFKKKKSYFYIEKDFDLNILNESLDSCNIFGIDTEFDLHFR